eukprot:gene35872-44235_t
MAFREGAAVKPVSTEAKIRPLSWCLRQSAWLDGSSLGLKVDLVDMAIPFLTKIFGSRNDRLLKQYRKHVDRINALETSLESLSDDDLRAKTQSFKDRVAAGETLDALLPEAFAV